MARVSVISVLIFPLLTNWRTSSNWLVIGMLWLTIGILINCSLTGVSSNLWWGFLVILYLGFSASNILLFYLIFELRLIPILIIILFKGSQPERLNASLYLLIYTRALSIPYLLVILTTIPVFYGFLFKLNLAIRPVFGIFLVAPFLVKIPVAGLHFWLPKAHVEANTSGSMVLAGLLLKLGRFGIFQLYFLVSGSIFSSIWLFLSLLSRYLVFVQSDLKKYIAYSRITHITFIIVGLVSSLKRSLLIVVIVSLAHGWASRGIFLRAGSIRHSVQTRLGLFNKINSFRWFLSIFGVLLLINASIPPRPSFFPEIFIVLTIGLISIKPVWLFLFLRFFVAYYNSFLFLLWSQAKASYKASYTFNITRAIRITLHRMSGLACILFISYL
jgi:NADH:ubiquinone oxidoreductase subunit 4 (subunit M)